MLEIKGFLSELTASLGTYDVLLGALLDVGGSEAVEQSMVSSYTHALICQ